MITEDGINRMIEKVVTNKGYIRVEKLQYIMDFGEVSVQYDFCLN
jgi:hypothetical protein